jgi:hypothetical protein
MKELGQPVLTDLDGWQFTVLYTRGLKGPLQRKYNLFTTRQIFFAVFFMSEINLKRSRNLRKEDFEKYERDIKTFLKAFSPQVLANWLKKDKGNVSRKLNGIESITSNDLADFYSKLGSAITKLQNGVPPYQIELEMNPVEEDPQVFRNLWEEVRLIKETLLEHGAAIRELKQDRQPAKEKDARNAPDDPADRPKP